ncbi:response regulator with CheY-like receiver, AAA-type ATPase, and DNA-binding domains [Nostoc sp. PCC 7524]|uniref:response regulator n=1 Tax=Nostoc sp. (strain ATCC 29411 / PCC 7524) TaxID=28072 RepID=UPI00029ED304|nr:response regulator [Nostoc sp. PCC 7524]AFY47671.1 response regulator with CheY-like receiver, AAA-type ATPase, and DNA-binding domains [Nostoc sp. PCC 7524]
MTTNLLTKPQRYYLHPSRRILLVEDNDINRMLLSDYLSYCNYNVKGLSNAADFFLSIDTFQPDLILLDLKLPDINGYVLLEKIQQQPNLLKIPIIVVSAFAFKSDQEKAMNLGARSYFVKPINLNLLTLAIEQELAYSCI